MFMKSAASIHVVQTKRHAYISGENGAALMIAVRVRHLPISNYRLDDYRRAKAIPNFDEQSIVWGLC